MRPRERSLEAIMNDTLKDDLNEAKGHAKEAARATLLAMRKGIDFAIDKLGSEDEPREAGEQASPGAAPAPSESPGGAPEGSITSPPAPDSGPGAGDA
jgi:hypothetical protein